MAADGVEDRLDVDQSKAERAVRDKKRLGPGYPLDADFGWHPAPGERRAAWTIRGDGEDACRASLQRLIGAVEQRPRAGGIGGGCIEQRGLARNRRRDVVQRRCDALDFAAGRAFDTSDCLGRIVGTQTRTLDGNACRRGQRRAHQAGQKDAAKRARH